MANTHPKETHAPDDKNRKDQDGGGFEIMGVPWQFAFIIGVILLGVLGILLKTLGLF